MMNGTASAGKSNHDQATPQGCIAAPCDHRYDADATWSHSTDTADAKTFYYAEACAFRFNLAVDVFDSPFRFSHPWMPLPEKQSAAATGRITFEVYFQTDRWHDPLAPAGGEPFPMIPDYYATQWSQAGVDAGFHVTSGEAKRARFPNHGQELFDLSGGKYGYDLATGRPGSIDVLAPLVEHQRRWIQHAFGYLPAAAAYKNGKSEEGAAYGLLRFFLGARGSIADGSAGYGKSKQGNGFLGLPNPFDLTHVQAARLSMTTRADSVFVVEVPFRRKEETVTVHLQADTGKVAEYMDFSLPSILSVSSEQDVLRVTTDKPARLALFAAPPGNDLGQVVLIGRSNALGREHTIDTGEKKAALEGTELYVGAITERRQSVLGGPYRIS